MQLNFGKCRVMHCGRRNRSFSYKFSDNTGSINIETTNRERDLGIIITLDLKWHEQVTSVTSKASKMLGLLRKSFRSRDSKLWRKLYMTYILPLLEYASVVWSPHQLGDIELLERVQRRFTKVPHKLRKMPFEERRKRLNLKSLESRRLRSDLIEAYYKILFSYLRLTLFG